MLCYARLLALSCPKTFSAQSDIVLFCAPDNKKLETANISVHVKD